MKRELGRVTLSGERPERTPEQQALADRALALLREEIARPADDGAARLEGACRFALRLGLVTPAEAREVFHEADQRGLVERGGNE